VQATVKLLVSLCCDIHRTAEVNVVFKCTSRELMRIDEKTINLDE